MDERLRILVVGRPIQPTEIACDARWIDGTLYVQAEPFAASLGRLLDARWRDDGVIFVRRRNARARERGFPRV